MNKVVSNSEIAELLYEIGEFLAMQEEPFKPRAYEKAGDAISELSASVEEIYRVSGVKGIEEIPGVGKSIASTIEEFILKGKSTHYEDLKKQTPVNLKELSSIEGLGPKSIKKLYVALKIKNLADLGKAARAHKISGLAGFGEKAEQNILKGIEFLKQSGGRFTLGEVFPIAVAIQERLAGVPGVEKVVIAGSTRRGRETVGDVDILAIAKDSERIMKEFVSFGEVAKVFAHGETKSAVKLKNGLDVDLRVVPKESYGSALNYFTGSKAHNVHLRQIAIKKGYKLNEYGLFKGSKQVAGKSEEEIYSKLGLDYVEPEMREDLGEIELALRQAQGKPGGLPKLIGYGDLKGDLQVQTDWTDGAHSIEWMAKEAIKHGLKYIAITDHTKRLAMTGGLDDKKILKQMAEIDRLNKKFAGKIKILKGSECDILKDGSMDLEDKTLAKLDVVGGSVHSHFNLSSKEQTERIMRAMGNKNVDIIFHPTGRVIKKREAYEVNIGALIAKARETGTILEIDAYPDRLDLKDEYIRKCVDAGVKLSIDSDAHSAEHFDFLKFGIIQARRGWAEKKDIINAWPVEKMLKMLKNN